MAEIELVDAGIVELMKSPEISQLVQAEASRVKSSCGSAYQTDTHEMPTRIIASVYTTDRDAIKDNLKNNTLLKAVSG